MAACKYKIHYKFIILPTLTHRIRDDRPTISENLTRTRRRRYTTIKILYETNVQEIPQVLVEPIDTGIPTSFTSFKCLRILCM